ncbi:hypothetical protein CMV_007350 [Castanea mollissima]|uniref:Reverse transcriptase zinc-binding domain-containing protein n=1 Tax=Castanea mollissima TaxID=60419 RepID=A0A8J4RNA2_9ROSI|nr:hypothetical protein CMV_007350 [Castanea mollissima]
MAIMAPSFTSLLVFTVRRCELELVAPAKPTPHEFKQRSDLDDRDNLRFQIPIIQFYRYNPSVQGRDPVKVIREALAQTLVLYYPFAGRLREGHGVKLMVECTGEGVMFIEADADVSLDQFGHTIHPPFPCMDELLYDVPSSEEMLNCALLLIQVTQLRCGGFISALRLNHLMSDAPSIVQIMNAMSEMAQGVCARSVPHVWQRELLNARNPPQVTCTHHEFDELVKPQSLITNSLHELACCSFFFGSTQVSAIRKSIPHHLGRLKEGSGGKLVVECTGLGVMFIEAGADISPEQFGHAIHPPFTCIDELLYDVPCSGEMLDCPLLLIQGWKWGVLSFELPLSIKDRIKAIPRQQVGREEDAIMWKLSKDGEFTTKSAYALIIGPQQNTIPFQGQWIWKIDTLPKVVNFLWLCKHNSVLVRSVLAMRGIITNICCPLCKNFLETTCYLLRDFMVAKDFWYNIKVPPEMVSSFVDMDLIYWLRVNCHSKVYHHSLMPWSYVFTFAIWNLWKQRNGMVFNNTALNGNLHRITTSQALQFFYCVGKLRSQRSMVVTRLRCGGFTFALRLNHLMGDAPGLALFMNAFGEIAQGACAPSIHLCGKGNFSMLGTHHR